jgi:hypothetical protein
MPEILTRLRAWAAERVRLWVDRHTAGPMLAATWLGVFLVVGALYGFEHTCSGHPTGLICKMATTSPPWLVVTSLIAGPSALLTWYWRTAHKKADMAAAARAQVAQRFATAVELLDKGGVSAMGAIYALEQIAKDSPPDQWTVIETLAAFIRTAKGADRNSRVQAALTVITRRNVRHDSNGGWIDLQDTNLMALNFDGMNLERFDLTRARLDGASLCKGTDLRHALFDPQTLWNETDAYHEQAEMQMRPLGDYPVIDDSLIADDAQRGALLALKARNLDEERRAERAAYEQEKREEAVQLASAAPTTG